MPQAKARGWGNARGRTRAVLSPANARASEATNKSLSSLSKFLDKQACQHWTKKPLLKDSKHETVHITRCTFPPPSPVVFTKAKGALERGVMTAGKFENTNCNADKMYNACAGSWPYLHFKNELH